MEHGETDDIPMELQKYHGISIILVPISNKNRLCIPIWLVLWNMFFIKFHEIPFLSHDYPMISTVDRRLYGYRLKTRDQLVARHSAAQEAEAESGADLALGTPSENRAILPVTMMFSQ